MRVSPEWATPTVIGAPVSTAGWEDSPQISPDGKSLYFSYFRVDPIMFMVQGVERLAGPVRPGWPTQWPYSELGADIYVAKRDAKGNWTTPQSLGAPVDVPEEHEGDQWVSSDGKRILFTNGDGSPRRPKGIYYSELVRGVWSQPVLAASKGFPFLPEDANPHLTLDEQTLFFASSRPGGYGDSDIWMSIRVNGIWQQPVCLGPEVNTGGPEGSPFSLDGKTLYFDDNGAGAIFRSTLTADGKWTAREIVVTGTVGDPSLTLAGDLYFTAASILRDTQGNIIGYDADLMVARKITATGSLTASQPASTTAQQ